MTHQALFKIGWFFSNAGSGFFYGPGSIVLHIYPIVMAGVILGHKIGNPHVPEIRQPFL